MATPSDATELPNSNASCETLTVRSALTVNGVNVTGGGGGGGGWTDDGAVVRLTTAVDQVAIGDPAPVGVAPLSVYEAASKWFAVGALDAFGRRGLWFTMTSSVLRMGANTADGDAFDATSDGAVVWDPAGNKAARIKADRFGLTRAADTALYYFRVDGNALFYRADPPGGTIWLNIDRATGQMDIGGALAHKGATAGFFATAPVAKPVIAGARGGNVALASLLTGLATLGLITDNTTP